jgi:hypothetical protein
MRKRGQTGIGRNDPSQGGAVAGEPEVEFVDRSHDHVEPLIAPVTSATQACEDGLELGSDRALVVRH